MRYKTLIIVSVFLLLSACKTVQKKVRINDHLVNCDLIAEDDFSGNLDNWIIEQIPGGTVNLIDGKMDINDSSGCTVWFNKKFEGNIMIEYNAIVIDSGGTFDRVSDLNCFWMATDVYNPDDFFANSRNRNGKFQNYHELQLYYVGVGGHNNTKTRFRRYAGGGERPILPEHDFSNEKYLIKANTTNKIKIVVFKSHIQYYYNGMLVYNFQDSNPFTEGYFGIRTYKNHMSVDNFRVYKLHE
jgi:hypothetical protein